MDVKQLAFLARQPSAALNSRERFWGMPKRGIALILANAMFWQPLMVQAEGIAVSGGGTSLTTAGNGVPVINIAAPNSSGLSHNTFDQYNVDRQGVILNNATNRTQSTQLGGIILGNSNLKGAAATTILNEVTGTNRTQLKGYTEVAGQAARVIIANPYGVTCNGCGFINTPRATLTTGKPILDQGRLDHFKVEGGDISIEGAGLNAGDIEQFDLITRSAKLNAALYAKKLTVVTGRNNVDAQTLGATALADDGSAKPELAIDSSALGGMYAGSIKLVGTEQGVGVKLDGELAASAGDVSIDANGKLTMNSAAASGALTVKAQSVQANDALYAGSDLSVTTQDDLFNQKSIAAAGNVVLASNGQLTNLGAIEAGVNPDDTRKLSGTVRIDAKNLRNAGQIVAPSDLVVSVTQDLDNRQGVIGASSGSVNVTAGGRVDNSHGSLKAETALIVNAAAMLNQTGMMLGSTIALTGLSLDNNNGVIVASTGAATVTTRGRLDNTLGKIQAKTNLVVNGAALINQSGTLLGKTVSVTGSSLDNRQGTVVASNGIAQVVTVEKLDNTQGTLQASSGLVVSGAELINQNGNMLGETTTVTGTSLDNRKGLIGSSNAVASVTVSGDLDNTQGTLNAATDLVVKGGGLVNQSGKLLGQTVTVTGTSLDNNAGVIASSSGAVSVTTDARVDSTNGTLQAFTDLIVRGAELVNHGGKLLGKTVDVIGSSLENNSGLIASSSGTVKVTTDNGLDNTDGILQAATDLVVGGADLVNQRGKLIGDTVVVTGSSLDNRAGLIGARTGALQVTTGGRLDSTQGTLQAETDLVVVAGEVVNQSGTVLGKTVTITGTSLDNSKKGSIIADTGDLKITIDQAVNNQQGRLQSTVGDITLTVGSLDNQLGVVVGEKVAVTTLLGALDNRGGQILGTRLDVDAKTSIDNRNAGQLVGGSDGLMLTTKRISNQQGTILAGGSHAELVLGQGRLDNQAGNISASSVGLTAGDVDNSAGSLTSLNGNLQLTVDRVTNRGGLIEASQKLLLDGQTLDNSAGGRLLAHLGDLSRVALKGDLDNRNGRIAIGSQAFSLQASTLFNIGGKIEHAATGLFSLRSANLLSNQGQMIGLGAGDWNVTNVNGVGLWHMNGALDIKGLQSISLQAGDRIASASSLSLEAANLTNSGELLGDGNLTLKLSGDLVNQGLISTQKALSIKAANLIQNGGRIASAGEAGLTINGTLDNLGRLTSGTHLTATADRIVNRGTLGAQRLLKLTAVKDIDNQQDSLIFAGGDMALRGDSLFNKYADIYSAGNFSFAAVDGNRASLLSNLSASIESAGDIDIKTRELDNSKAEFESTQEAISREMLMDCDDCSGDVHSGSYIVRTTYQGAVLKDSPASRLLANRDLLLDAVTVTNGQSLLAANSNATITATNFYNRGFTLDNRVENVNYYLRSVSQSAYRVAESATNAWNRKNVGLAMEDQAPIPTAVTRYGIRDTTSTILPGNGTTYTGTVQAGATLKLNISNELVNGSLTDQGNAQLTGATLDSSTVGAGGRQVILGAPVGSPGAVKDVQRIQTTAADGSVKFSFVPVDFSGAPFVSVDPTSLSSFRLPQGSFGLFTQNRNPAAQYLIETNPSLVDTAKFMSSDYLLSNLGYDPAEADRRLGDGRYESRLIADAVRAQTGQRFLADGISSDYEQFQYLMDNAVASKDELGLSLGVGLTSEQVAALTHDLVWMEERVVEGETVLTPVLYLAKVDSRNLRGGSLIQGRNVEMITGGDLKNVGTLRASEDLTALSGGSIYQGGLVQANNNLTMLATNSIRNALAGEIRGDKVNLTTLTGDIINDRTAVQFTIGNDTRTQLDAGSSITAGSELTINAGKDLTNKGQISSGGNAALTAGNDINLLSVEDRNVEKNVLRRGMRTEETITQMGSSVTAKGDLSLKAGNDINAVASKASAGRDLTVEAGNDVNLMSAADEHNLESRFKKGNKKVHEVDNQSRQVASEFTAGRDLDIYADGDVNLVASNLKAGDEAYVYAGKNLNLLAAQNTDYTLYDMKKKGGWGSKKTQRDEVTKVTHVGSQITTVGDLTLESGGDQRYQVAKLDSGKDLTIESGGAITFEGVKDLHQESHEKSSNSLAWTSMSGKGNTDETLRQTQMIAKGELAIRAVDGLKIDIKEVNKQTVSQTIDAMVKADPQLAWLKEAEQRGDVDWQLIKETHDAYKYSHSSLGQGAMLAIIIIVTIVTAGTGTAATIGGAASQAAVAAGYAGAATAASAAAIASFSAAVAQAAVSVVNNKGDLGAAFKDVTSADAMKGYVISGLAAGFAAGVLDKSFGVKTADLSKATHGFELGTMDGFTKFAGYTAAQGGFNAVANTAINGGSLKDNLAQVAISSAADVLTAGIYNKLGSQLEFSGLTAKVGAHALVGGLIAELAGGDFRTGALAAGANEAFVASVGDKIFAENSRDQLLAMTSQLIGLTVAAAAGGSDKDQAVASWVASQATKFNSLDHPTAERLLDELKACKANRCSADEQRSLMARFEKVSADRSALLAACPTAECRENIRANTIAMDDPVAQELVAWYRERVSYDMVGLLTGDPSKIAMPAQGYDPWGAKYVTDDQIILALNIQQNTLTPAQQAYLDSWNKETGWMDRAVGRVLTVAEKAEMLVSLGNAMLTEGWGKASGGNSASGSGVVQGGSGAGPKATVSSPLKLGETKAIDDVSMTRVGRWMFPDELAQMQNTNKVVQGGGGQTFISTNGIADFKGAAPKGSVYVEFDVPANSLLQGGKDGWFKMIGPDAGKSQQFLLNKQGGEHLPAIKNIEILDKK
ncbi:DUF637 domain-containing protein [Pseudomonas syringae group sp. J309-1]|uniref:two-partner secretion domain-containing protein n=1 Tax=Pseudomonas syringae group sp. J309-1 TaxID=3079588 RepID=UPI0029155F5D|nr:DUF637 domain-containing protein [Pseudomonas syringae group sp. J309-1]MDU8359244.1 DUF637 domain-containing protein [Pseudomonas syringae group sp. J309-1]